MISCSETFDEFRHRFANSCLSPENHLVQRFCADRSPLAVERLGFPADKRGITESPDMLVCNWNTLRDSHSEGNPETGPLHNVCSARRKGQTNTEDCLFSQSVASHCECWRSSAELCLLHWKHQTINRGDNEEGNFHSPPDGTDLRESVKTFQTVREILPQCRSWWCLPVNSAVGVLNV